jgi:hypothetical protein
MAWYVGNVSFERKRLFVPVPSDPEIEFVMQILENLLGPTLDKVEKLLESTSSWDNVARNDFCRSVIIISFEVGIYKSIEAI